MFRCDVWFAGLTLILGSLVSTPAACGHDSAERVFRQCQHELQHLTRSCINTNWDIAEECVREIRILLEKGRVEQATRLARQCIHEIERRTLHCLVEMSDLCERCVHRLLELDAPRLAARFRSNCEHAAEEVLVSARLAIHAIKSQFDDR